MLYKFVYVFIQIYTHYCGIQIHVYEMVCTNLYVVRIHITITEFVQANLFFNTNLYVQICILQLRVYKPYIFAFVLEFTGQPSGK
jgi:hypothetical protein